MAARGKKRAPPEPARTLTRQELATALGGISPRTIEKWLEEGLPVASRGRGGRPSRYDLATVQAWLKARDDAAAAAAPNSGALDLVRERARKEHWQAHVAEQLYLTRGGELLPRAEVERAWSAERDAIRTKILSVWTTHADRVFRAATLEGLPGVEAALKAIAHDILRELAAGAHAEEPPKPAKKRKRGAA